MFNNAQIVESNFLRCAGLRGVQSVQKEYKVPSLGLICTWNGGFQVSIEVLREETLSNPSCIGVLYTDTVSSLILNRLHKERKGHQEGSAKGL